MEIEVELALVCLYVHKMVLVLLRVIADQQNMTHQHDIYYFFCYFSVAQKKHGDVKIRSRLLGGRHLLYSLDYIYIRSNINIVYILLRGVYIFCFHTFNFFKTFCTTPFRSIIINTRRTHHM